MGDRYFDDPWEYSLGEDAMILSDDAACCPVLRDRAGNGLGHVSERIDSKGKTRMPLDKDLIAS
jgi:hypothetical protein